MSSAAAEPRILVSVATYNERENLPKLIEEIHGQLTKADVLVIDDHSPDGTGPLADELAAKDPRIHVLHRPGKLGLGTAILAGMKYAMEQNYDFVITMDADFSHHPRYLPPMVAGMDQNDIMVGSRYIPGGGTVHWPLSRKLMSRSIGVWVRLMLRVPAKDTSGGYRCYRVSKLRDVQFDRMISHGYSFQQEMLFRCKKAGCRIGETPIIFENRRAGSSKVNPKEAARSIGVLVYLGFRNAIGLEK